MLPPHELKTKKFATVFRGYSPDEVDDQIAFLVEQYTELYRENDELERKLRLALAQLDAYKSDEESIRSALINAQKAGSKILRDSSERSELLLKAARETCDRMVSESAIAIRRQYAVLTRLREQSAALRSAMIEQYQAQLAQVEESVLSDAELVGDPADEDVVHTIIAGIKEEAVRLSEEKEEPAPAKRPRSGTIWNKESAQNEPPTPLAHAAALAANREAREETEEDAAAEALRSVMPEEPIEPEALPEQEGDQEAPKDETDPDDVQGLAIPLDAGDAIAAEIEEQEVETKENEQALAENQTVGERE